MGIIHIYFSLSDTPHKAFLSVFSVLLVRKMKNDPSKNDQMKKKNGV